MKNMGKYFINRPKIKGLTNFGRKRVKGKEEKKRVEKTTVYSQEV
jgi:hypothetical protein